MAFWIRWMTLACSIKVFTFSGMPWLFCCCCGNLAWPSAAGSADAPRWATVLSFHPDLRSHPAPSVSSYRASLSKAASRAKVLKWLTVTKRSQTTQHQKQTNWKYGHFFMLYYLVWCSPNSNIPCLCISLVADCWCVFMKRLIRLATEHILLICNM